MKDKLKILWKHPNLRDYRLPLFRNLEQKYFINFIFTRKSEWDTQYSHIILEPQKKIPLKSIIFYKKLLFSVFTKKYDLFIASFITAIPTIAAIIAVKLQRKKVVIWEEKWISNQKFKTKIMEFIIKYFIGRLVDNFFVCGNCQKKYLVSLGIDERKIFMECESSLDITRFMPQKHSHNIKVPSSNKVILYIGRIIKIKGVDFLIRAFAEVESCLPNALLLIVGDGEEKNNCIKLAQDLGINNIKFTGSINDNGEKAFIYKNSTTVVVPSIITDKMRAEGGPIVIPESFSAGKPVIVSDAIGSTLDIVQEGVNGEIFEQKNYKQLAQKIKSILSLSEEAYEKYCINAKNTYDSRCNYKNISEKFIECIEASMRSKL